MSREPSMVETCRVVRSLWGSVTAGFLMIAVGGALHALSAGGWLWLIPISFGAVSVLSIIVRALIPPWLIGLDESGRALTEAQITQAEQEERGREHGPLVQRMALAAGWLADKLDRPGRRR